MPKTIKRSKPYIAIVETADWLLKLTREDQVNGRISISADVLNDYLLNIKEHSKELETRNNRAANALRRVIADMEDQQNDG